MILVKKRSTPDICKFAFLGESGFVMENLLGSSITDISMATEQSQSPRFGIPGSGYAMYNVFNNNPDISFKITYEPFQDPTRQKALCDFLFRQGKFREVKFMIFNSSGQLFQEISIYGSIATDLADDYIQFRADHFQRTYV